MSSDERPAYLNNQRTTARKMGGKWLVGGDVPQKGDHVAIAVKHPPMGTETEGRSAWHTLKGNRLKFDDYIENKELKEHELPYWGQK